MKTGHSDDGPAWIARVKLSKSGRTIYFNGRALKRAKHGGLAGNHYDLQTLEEYWVSGIKLGAADRHWAGSGIVFIEASAVDEYLRLIGTTELDTSRFRVVDDLQETEPSAFHHLENEVLER